MSDLYNNLLNGNEEAFKKFKIKEYNSFSEFENIILKKNGAFNDVLVRNNASIKNFLDKENERFIDKSDNYKEICYRSKFNLIEVPKCKICGKPANFISFSNGYGVYCSRSCHGKGNAILLEERTGERCTLRLPENQKKTKDSLIKHYGVTHNYSIPEEHIRDANKIEEFLNKYNRNKDFYLTHPNNYLSLYKRFPEECKELIGIDLDENINDNIEEICVNDEKQNKLSLSERRNGFDSLLEKDVDELLDQFNIKRIYHYSSDKRYPFECDFYLPDLDIFYEIQGFISHNGCKFDNKNKEHKKILQELVNKFEDPKICDVERSRIKSILITWACRDVYKRNYAKEHNAKLVEIFTDNPKDVINDILNLYKERGFNIKEKTP